MDSKFIFGIRLSIYKRKTWNESQVWLYLFTFYLFCLRKWDKSIEIGSIVRFICGFTIEIYVHFVTKHRVYSYPIVTHERQISKMCTPLSTYGITCVDEQFVYNAMQYICNAWMIFKVFRIFGCFKLWKNCVSKV